MKFQTTKDSDHLFKVPYPTTLVQIGSQEACISWVTQGSHEEKICQQWLSIDSNGVHLFYAQDHIGYTAVTASNEFLAVGTSDGIDVFQKLGKAFVAKINIKNAASLFFDNKQQLWFLSGQTLFKATPGEFNCSVKKRNVKVASGFKFYIYYIYREDNTWYLCVETTDGRVFKTIILPSPFEENVRFSIQIADPYAFIIIQPKFHTGNAPLQIVAVDLHKESGNITIRDFVPINHFGLKELKVISWINGSVIIQVEKDNCISLFCYDPCLSLMTRLSLGGHEVLVFSASIERGVIHYIATEIDQGKKFRSIFQVAYRDGKYRVIKLYENVGTTLCTFSNGDCLFFEMKDGVLIIRLWKHDSATVDVLYKSLRNTIHSLLPIITIDSNIFENVLSNLSRDKALILFVPGVHKPVIPGLQSNLFQEGIYRILESLNSKEVQSILAQLPGAAGEGKIYRTCADFRKKDLFVSSLEKIIRKLMENGFVNIVLISGSSGSPLLLDFLKTTDLKIPTIFINPIFYMGSFAGIDLDVKSAIMDYLDIQAKTLILHAKQDEVASWQDSERFAKSNTQCQLYTLEGESHIFTRGSSWQLCQETIRTFLTYVRPVNGKHRHTTAELNQ